MPQPDDTLTLVAGGQRLTGWESVSVTRGIEIMPSSFEIALTEKYPGQAADIVVKPGDPCVVLIGNDPVVTGYIDRYLPAIAPRQHTVRIHGRSKCEDLVDCSAGVYPVGTPGAGAVPYQVRGMVVTTSSLLAMAQDLASPFGITVSSLTGDDVPVSAAGGGPVQFSIVLTETPYEIIERVARYAAVLAYDGTDGNLILANVNAGTHASGFKQGVNVQPASVAFTMDERYSIYLPSIMSTDYLHDLGTGGLFLAPAYDTAVPRFRPLIVVSDQSQYGQLIAEKRAVWEQKRRWGRSQAVRLTCDSWRDSAGTLWSPNFLAPVDLPVLKVVAQTWIVAQVTFHRSAQTGTTADVVLMPQEAFMPEPSTLQLYDWQIGQALQPGGAAKPPEQPAGTTQSAPAPPAATGGAAAGKPSTLQFTDWDKRPP